MRIFILTMDEPVYTLPFIKHILDKKNKDIIGLAITPGNRLVTYRNRSKLGYIISLFLIMGFPFFLKNSYITVSFKIKKILSRLGIVKDPSIIFYAKQYGIKTIKIISPNSKEFLIYLKKLKPDIIINQSQSILKKGLLNIPKIGILNRHGALLPKNRGRLSPFWILYKNESLAGVTIHFVDEKLDSGDIIVQKSYPVTNKDTFKTLVNKNYEIAHELVIKALDLLENGFSDFHPNNDMSATYNTIPTLNEALHFRIHRIKTNFKRFIC